jgi:hypothetical protein
MRVDENNTVILEKKNCHCSRHSRAKPGYVVDRFQPKLCPKCKGTGRRGNGRCRNCNDRDGYFSLQFPRTPGYIPDYEKFTTKVCPTCNGNWKNALDEDLTDTLPAHYLTKIPIRVIRMPNRSQTFNEAHIGAGTIYSVTDYGEHSHHDDDWIINKIRDSIKNGGFVARQATKYTDRNTMKLCDGILVITSYNGFSAYANFIHG